MSQHKLTVHISMNMLEYLECNPSNMWCNKSRNPYTV